MSARLTLKLNNGMVMPMAVRIKFLRLRRKGWTGLCLGQPCSLEKTDRMEKQ